MAGIGFELKKMFHKKGLFAKIHAYGYAGIVCIGPMLLGFLLLFLIRWIATWGGATLHETELLNSIVTYCLLGSLLLTNTFSLVVTRFIADQMYTENKDSILNSFFGSLGIMLVIGEIAMGVFLCFAGIDMLLCILCFLLFGVLIAVWHEMNYLTAIKDYQGIIVTFALSLLGAIVMALVLVLCKLPVVPSMLVAVMFAYGMMMIHYYKLLTDYFPYGNESGLLFLEWIDRYPQLLILGFSITMGLFAHLVIMWTSPVRVQVQGLFYGAPTHDIPAVLAFFSILVTTINFVTSVEVNFYPTYRNYFSLFNDKGVASDIKQAEKEMKIVLLRELTNTFFKQVFCTFIFVIAGSVWLPRLPLGITSDMLGIYRVLCLAYAFYAIGNCVMLIQLYFSDNTGAMISGVVFMIASCGLSWHIKYHSVRFYGLGFLVGSMLFFFTASVLLVRYMYKIKYHVLCEQPIVKEVCEGVFTKISRKYEWKYNQKYGIKGELEDEE